MTFLPSIKWFTQITFIYYSGEIAILISTWIDGGKTKNEWRSSQITHWVFSERNGCKIT